MTRGMTKQEHVAHTLIVALGSGCLIGLLFGVIAGNIPFGVAVGLGVSLLVAVLRIVSHRRRCAAQQPGA